LMDRFAARYHRHDLPTATTGDCPDVQGRLNAGDCRPGPTSARTTLPHAGAAGEGARSRRLLRQVADPGEARHWTSAWLPAWGRYSAMHFPGESVSRPARRDRVRLA